MTIPEYDEGHRNGWIGPDCENGKCTCHDSNGKRKPKIMEKLFICDKCKLQKLISQYNKVNHLNVCNRCLEKMEVEQLIAIHTGTFPIIRQNKKIRLGVRTPKIILTLEN